jgi:hypothetical protein
MDGWLSAPLLTSDVSPFSALTSEDMGWGQGDTERERERERGEGGRERERRGAAAFSL